MGELSGFNAAALGIAMIAAALLAIGGMKLLRPRDTRKRGILMLVAAAVLVMNVMIWTV